MLCLKFIHFMYWCIWHPAYLWYPPLHWTLRSPGKAFLWWRSSICWQEVSTLNQKRRYHPQQHRWMATLKSGLSCVLMSLLNDGILKTCKYFLMSKNFNISKDWGWGKSLQYYNFSAFIIIFCLFTKSHKFLKNIKIVSTIFSWFYLEVPRRWNWCRQTVAPPPQVWRRFCTHLCAPCPRSCVYFPCWPWFLTDLLQL